MRTIVNRALSVYFAKGTPIMFGIVCAPAIATSLQRNFRTMGCTELPLVSQIRDLLLCLDDEIVLPSDYEYR